MQSQPSHLAAHSLFEVANSIKVKGEYKIPKGMPLSVWEDKYARRKEDGSFQNWGERIREVTVGNFLLDQYAKGYTTEDFEDAVKLGLKGVMLYSGRHLQHGDLEQPSKPMEIFTNCSTAAFSFMLFYLLLCGSGVGADYSERSRKTNYSKYMPNLRFVLEAGEKDEGDITKGSHPDFAAAYNEFSGLFDTKNEALHKYSQNHEKIRWITVEDTREGWANLVEEIETATWEATHKDDLFIIDFTKVRAAGLPIKGQQNRPASGPLPLMRALAKIYSIRGIPDMPCWKQAMFVDHYLAASVVLGGVRRSARMATKFWKDKDVFDFINIKQGGYLWSANISIVVDKEFWDSVDKEGTHAYNVFKAATYAQFTHTTGEPGFITVDNMVCNIEGLEHINAKTYINKTAKLKLQSATDDMLNYYLEILKKIRYPFILNPCGEIIISLWGGYCVIGDLCLANAKTKKEALRAAELMAQALVRVNTMNSLYNAEVKRTNRIGVSLTGIHEFAANLWGLNFYDLINADNLVSDIDKVNPEIRETAMDFWAFINEMREAVEKSANAYCDALGVNYPHTYTTIKPSGTVGKVANCTEGAHLPAMPYYMRWVQFIKEIAGKANPELKKFTSKGYPTRDVSHVYSNAMIVGFPTKQRLADILGDRIVCAEDATPLEQFEWIRLIEKYWFGTNEDGTPRNNNCSYTLKWKPETINLKDYKAMILKNQPTVRCCAIMPVVNTSAYAYQPEEKISREFYEQYMSEIKALDHEAYDVATLDCAGGVCALDPNIN